MLRRLLLTAFLIGLAAPGLAAPGLIAQDGPTANRIYIATYRISFADMDVWNGMWEEKVFPVVERLMADGLLNGYVVQGHNTGGRFNWKFAWLYDEWDNFDEIEGAVFEALPPDDPLWRLFSAHRDELWQALPPD